MKKILYKCDFCGEEIEHEFKSFWPEPKELYQLGMEDACRECFNKAYLLLDTHFKLENQSKKKGVRNK